jgi:hypothetical protein
MRRNATRILTGFSLSFRFQRDVSKTLAARRILLQLGVHREKLYFSSPSLNEELLESYVHRYRGVIDDDSFC